MLPLEAQNPAGTAKHANSLEAPSCGLYVPPGLPTQDASSWQRSVFSKWKEMRPQSFRGGRGAAALTTL
jgi:hypothetical protein